MAQCFAGEDDLQALMVSAGWAWSFGRYSERYAPEERAAVVGKLGVHGHRCVPPSEWRAQQQARGRPWDLAYRRREQSRTTTAGACDFIHRSVKLPICTGAVINSEPLSLRLISAYP